MVTYIHEVFSDYVVLKIIFDCLTTHGVIQQREVASDD